MDLILFDFDGVLVDSFDSHIQFYYDTAEKLKIRISKERIEKALKKRDDVFLNMGFSPEMFDLVHQDYKQKFHTYPNPVFPGIPQLLEKIRDAEKHVCIATSNLRKHVDAFFRDYLNFFTEIKTRDNGGKAQNILELINKYPDLEPMFFGDTLWDLRTARETRIPFTGIGYGWHDLSNQGIGVIESVNDLEKYILSSPMTT